MVSLEQVRALEDRVEKAVSYIAALRAENAELERRLSEDKAIVDDAAAAAAARVSEAEKRVQEAEARLSASEAMAGEAQAARDAALGRVREFEARVSDMAERVAAAETRAAEIGARAEEYKKDQARIEEGIIHALEKLDSFEDLVLSRPSEPERAEGSSGIAVKAPPRAGASSAGASSADAPPADRGAGELDIF